MQRLVLASGSPRRIEMFQKGGLNPEVRIPKTEERFPEGLSVERTVMYLALSKALAVERTGEEGFLVAADTVVYNGRILGKPSDAEEALKMLEELRGKVHQVLTGVAIIQAGSPNRKVFYEATEVGFLDYTREDMEEYIRTGEPLDKAGAYAIQGRWGKHIGSVNGDRDNVIGFPWRRAMEKLREMGFRGV